MGLFAQNGQTYLGCVTIRNKKRLCSDQKFTWAKKKSLAAQGLQATLCMSAKLFGCSKATPQTTIIHDLSQAPGPVPAGPPCPALPGAPYSPGRPHLLLPALLHLQHLPPAVRQPSRPPLLLLLLLLLLLGWYQRGAGAGPAAPPSARLRLQLQLRLQLLQLLQLLRLLQLLQLLQLRPREPPVARRRLPALLA